MQASSSSSADTHHNASSSSARKQISKCISAINNAYQGSAEISHQRMPPTKRMQGGSQQQRIKCHKPNAQQNAQQEGAESPAARKPPSRGELQS
jgi:hypothetical protein